VRGVSVNSKKFIAKLQDIVDNYKTVYMWGVFGSPVSEAIIRQKSSQYPSWYTADRQANLKSLIGKGYFGFDCVNMIKAVLWGWNGDPNHSYGGAKYASNGVPDLDADRMFQHCRESSGDFTKIIPGEAVWHPGHIGIYIGNGMVIECTPAWQNGVQITALANQGNIAGLNAHWWEKHGKLPYIIYEESMEVRKVDYLILCNPGVDERAAGYLGDYLRCPVANIKTVSKETIQSIGKAIYVVGTSEHIPDAKCRVENILGANRYETCQAVLNLIKKGVL
jgi:hypothetical protein